MEAARPSLKAAASCSAFPGAPGCTTTGGGAESGLLRVRSGQNKPVATLAARSMPHSKTDTLAELWRAKTVHIPVRLRSKHFECSHAKNTGERKDAEMRLAPSNHQIPRNLCRIGTGGRSSSSHRDRFTEYHLLCISPSRSIVVVDCKAQQVAFTRLPSPAVNSTKLLPAAKLGTRCESILVLRSLATTVLHRGFKSPTGNAGSLVTAQAPQLDPHCLSYHRGCEWNRTPLFLRPVELEREFLCDSPAVASLALVSHRPLSPARGTTAYQAVHEENVLRVISIPRKIASKWKRF